MPAPPNEAESKDVNGIFEGGGAKGILYVGAIAACENRGLTFKAVAGSSAGAITAMLLSLDYAASEIQDEMTDAIKALGSVAPAVAFLGRRSLLSSKDLHQWLEKMLKARIGKDGPITFADIRGSTGKTLYVVTMDLSTGQPLVFSPDLTPNASVADAVVASSAIPVAFPAQRFKIDGQTRRLIDGGVWANYPRFIFLDDEFREFHHLNGTDGDRAKERKTIGFVLGDSEPVRVPRDASSEITLKAGRPWSTDSGSAAEKMKFLGGLVTSPLVMISAMLLPVGVLVVGASWFDRLVEDKLSLIKSLPDGSADSFADLSLVILIALFAVLIVQSIIFAYGVARIGGSMADEGLVGASAAVGVGPKVPYWVGHPSASSRHGDVTVRLNVPTGLTTLKARIPEGAIQKAEDETEFKLARFFGDPHVEERARPLTAAGGENEQGPEPSRFARLAFNPISAAVLMWGGYIALVDLAMNVVEGVWEDRVPWISLAVLFLCGTAMLVFHVLLRTHRANWPDSSWLRRRRSGLLLPLSIVLFLTGLFWVAIAGTSDRELLVHERMESTEVVGEVGQVDPCSTEECAYEYLVHIMFATELPPYLDGSEPAGEWQGYQDLNDGPVEECRAASPTSSCRKFLTDTEYAPGSEVRFRYHEEKGIAFLDDDFWVFASFLSTLYPALAVWFLALSYGALGALRWRKDNVGSESASPPDQLATHHPQSHPPPPAPAAPALKTGPGRRPSNGPPPPSATRR